MKRRILVTVAVLLLTSALFPIIAISAKYASKFIVIDDLNINLVASGDLKGPFVVYYHTTDREYVTDDSGSQYVYVDRVLTEAEVQDLGGNGIYFDGKSDIVELPSGARDGYTLLAWSATGVCFDEGLFDYNETLETTDTIKSAYETHLNSATYLSEATLEDGTPMYDALSERWLTEDYGGFYLDGEPQDASNSLWTGLDTSATSLTVAELAATDLRNVERTTKDGVSYTIIHLYDVYESDCINFGYDLYSRFTYLKSAYYSGDNFKKEDVDAIIATRTTITTNYENQIWFLYRVPEPTIRITSNIVGSPLSDLTDGVLEFQALFHGSQYFEDNDFTSEISIGKDFDYDSTTKSTDEGVATSKSGIQIFYNGLNSTVEKAAKQQRIETKSYAVYGVDSSNSYYSNKSSWYTVRATNILSMQIYAHRGLSYEMTEGSSVEFPEIRITSKNTAYPYDCKFYLASGLSSSSTNIFEIATKKVYAYCYINTTLSSIIKDTCFAEGTLILMADGTQKPIEEVRDDDLVMVFNHETGQYEAAAIMQLDRDGTAEYTLINLEFSDGRRTRLIYEHGLFDLDLNQYVYIHNYDYEQYIGHRFAVASADGGYDEVTLTNAYLTVETVGCYSMTTMYHFNYFIDGLFSMPGGSAGLFNYFEYGEGLKYDEEKMQADIEKYGLYTYDDFAEYVPYEVFAYATPAKYFKVAVGKGLLTYEQILEYIEMYQDDWINTDP